MALRVSNPINPLGFCETCAVGGNILEAIQPVLSRARNALEKELSKSTIADIAGEVARLGKFTIPLTW